MRRLNQFNLKINPEKCKVGLDYIDILGHRLSPKGISAQPAKIQQINEFGLPRTGADLASVLGSTGFLSGYAPHYSTLVHPLNELKHRKVLTDEDWTPAHKEAFSALKAILSEGQVLEPPDFSRQMHVATDASNVGVGAVLYQLDDEGNKHFIQFASASLTKGQRSYHTTMKELTGIMFALRQFRYYLLGGTFQLHTDHRALTFLYKQHHLNPMLERWLHEFLEYDMEISHCPGPQNVIPYGFSRLYPDAVKLKL
eukprot:Nk52_evm2s1558 gene=Nk52_evmTU2s1558